MPILSFILAQAAVLDAEPLANPLEGASSEWVMCIHPDDTAKTCHTISSFTRLAGNEYAELDQSAVVGLPGLVIEVASKSTVKDGKLCGFMRRSDIQISKIVRHVEGATRKQEQAAVQQLGFMYPIEGKEVCSAFFPDGQHLVTRTWVNGKPMPEMSIRARWVHKDDGYVVTGWRGAITTPQ